MDPDRASYLILRGTYPWGPRSLPFESISQFRTSHGREYSYLRWCVEQWREHHRPLPLLKLVGLVAAVRGNRRRAGWNVEDYANDVLENALKGTNPSSTRRRRSKRSRQLAELRSFGRELGSKDLRYRYRYHQFLRDPDKDRGS